MSSIAPLATLTGYLAARNKRFALRRRDVVLVVLVLLAAGCTTAPQHEAPKSTQGTVWEVSCRRPVKAKVSSYKAVLAMPAPLCAQTVIESRLDFATSNATRTAMPSNQTFQKILDGKVANWSWDFVGTPSIAQEWHAGPVAPRAQKTSGSRTQSEKIPWSKAFADMHAIYRYVLNTPPPPTQFRLHFVPMAMGYSVKRTETATTSLHGPITMSLYFPYAQKLAQAQKSKTPYVTAQRVSYTIAIFVSCFEYMHVLFFTGRLKVPNVLSHSVADWITCWAVAANAQSAAGGHPTKKFPDTEQIRAEIKEPLNNSSDWRS